jgi:hypothetical protein
MGNSTSPSIGYRIFGYRLLLQGFSPRNLKYMRAFAEAWPDEQFVQQVAAQMPWFHNCMLLEKVGEVEQRTPNTR